MRAISVVVDFIGDTFYSYPLAVLGMKASILHQTYTRQRLARGRVILCKFPVRVLVFCQIIFLFSTRPFFVSHECRPIAARLSPPGCGINGGQFGGGCAVLFDASCGSVFLHDGEY